MSCYFYFLCGSNTSGGISNRKSDCSFLQKRWNRNDCYQPLENMYVSASPMFFVRSRWVFRNPQGLLTIPFAGQMYLCFDVTIQSYRLRSPIMTVHFHEYVLILLSTTALYLTLQAYCVFQAKKNMKPLKGRLILLLEGVIPINCITIKSIITETRKDFIGRWFEDLNN